MILILAKVQVLFYNTNALALRYTSTANKKNLMYFFLRKIQLSVKVILSVTGQPSFYMYKYKICI